MSFPVLAIRTSDEIMIAAMVNTLREAARPGAGKINHAHMLVKADWPVHEVCRLIGAVETELTKPHVPALKLVRDKED